MLELMRLDQLLKAIYTNAKNGDIAAIERCLVISMRRARLLRLDRQRSVGRFGSDEDPDAPRVVRVEIVGDLEVERVGGSKNTSVSLKPATALGQRRLQFPLSQPFAKRKFEMVRRFQNASAFRGAG
jgi:hypothetical protein